MQTLKPSLVRWSAIVSVQKLSFTLKCLVSATIADGFSVWTGVRRMGVWWAERKATVARIDLRRSAMQEVDADIYLALAVDCLRKARHEDADHWMYVSIANAWIKLADRTEADDASQGDQEAGPEAGSLG